MNFKNTKIVLSQKEREELQILIKFNVTTILEDWMEFHLHHKIQFLKIDVFNSTGLFWQTLPLNFPYPCRFFYPIPSHNAGWFL